MAGIYLQTDASQCLACVTEVFAGWAFLILTHGEFHVEHVETENSDHKITHFANAVAQRDQAPC